MRGVGKNTAGNTLPGAVDFKKMSSKEMEAYLTKQGHIKRAE